MGPPTACLRSPSGLAVGPQLGMAVALRGLAGRTIAAKPAPRRPRPPADALVDAKDSRTRRLRPLVQGPFRIKTV